MSTMMANASVKKRYRVEGWESGSHLIWRGFMRSRTPAMVELSQAQIKSILLEHAEYDAVGDDHAGYLTVWNGTGADKPINYPTVEGSDNAEITKWVSDDVSEHSFAWGSLRYHRSLNSTWTLGGFPHARKAPAAINPKVVVSFEDGSAASTNCSYA